MSVIKRIDNKGRLWTLISLAAGLIFMVFLFRSPVGQQLLRSRDRTLLPVIIVIASLVDSINPCAFSVLFLTVAFLFSLGRSRRSIVKTGMLYILGIFLVYLLIGLGVLQTLNFFNIPNFMAKIGAIAILVAGIINLINEFFPKFPIRLKIPSASHPVLARLIEKGSAPTAFVLGILVGMFEFPCTGGPYLMVLGLLHDQGTFLSGFFYLVLYDLIFVSPLALILAIASDEGLLKKTEEFKKRNSEKYKWLPALIMVILGLLILLI